jgi:hypothetical protein
MFRRSPGFIYLTGDSISHGAAALVRGFGGNFAIPDRDAAIYVFANWRIGRRSRYGGGCGFFAS